MNKKTINTAGKRKRAIARLLLREGQGLVRINSQALESFSSRLVRSRIKEPLILVGDLADKIHVDITVHGGGVMSQADAIRVALGRALAQFGGEKVKKILFDYDRNFLVQDIRRKEQRKPNDSKARKQRQSSKR